MGVMDGGGIFIIHLLRMCTLSRGCSLIFAHHRLGWIAAAAQFNGFAPICG